MPGTRWIQHSPTQRTNRSMVSKRAESVTDSTVGKKSANTSCTRSMAASDHTGRGKSGTVTVANMDICASISASQCRHLNDSKGTTFVSVASIRVVILSIGVGQLAVRVVRVGQVVSASVTWVVGQRIRLLGEVAGEVAYPRWCA